MGWGLARFVSLWAAPLALCASVAVANAGECPGNPDALGTSRTIVVDPREHVRIGTMDYAETLPLLNREVVLTFDDGPIPPYTGKVLDILAAECVKATYFIVGTMAKEYPALVRRAYDEGHTIGTHSEDHPLHFGELPLERMRSEIDVGISDVAAALGDTKYMAPFFRIPGLDRSNLLEEELAARHLIVFSSDTVADDWRRIGPEQIRSLALKRLQALGKGILLLHDIHAKTVAALPGILKDLKDNGFRIVNVVPAGPGMPETVAPAAADMRVAWTSAQQQTMDDSGNAPIWPTLDAGLQPEHVALVAPDAEAVATHYLLAPAAVPE